MRINSKPSAQREEERREYLSNWHPYFAWWPVRLYDIDQIAWLERVYRKGERYHCGYGYEWKWTYSPVPILDHQPDRTE